MRVFFIKDFLQDGRLFKAGSNAILWDATDAISSKSAIPYDQRSKVTEDEPQTKKKTIPQSSGTKENSKSKTGKINKN